MLHVAPYRNGIIAGVALLVGVAVQPGPARATCAVEPYIGSICFTAADFCPAGYLKADGTILQVRQSQALFSLLGYRYGGNNSTEFALPDLRTRSPIGAGTFATETITLGQKVGVAKQLLQASQVPLVPHTHSATFTGTGGGGTGAPHATGTITLPVTGSVNGLPVSANANLPVTGKAMIGSTSTTGRTTALGDKSVLTAVGGPGAQIYAPAGTSNDRQLGPDAAVTGSAQGTVSTTASGGTLSGQATGTVNLPVTGATGITGGTVTVAPASQAATVQLDMRDPALGLTACIAELGLYPSRP